MLFSQIIHVFLTKHDMKNVLSASSFRNYPLKMQKLVHIGRQDCHFFGRNTI